MSKEDVVFTRKIYNKLLAWKNEWNGESALLIEGARRIGKSTICREFGRREYESFIVVDFNNASKHTLDAFENFSSDLDTLFMVLQSEYRVDLVRRKSLVIFDEVQNYPKVRQLIKYLVEDGRYDYIETGSLISIKENVKGITLPSEERHIHMYPMDFEEFAWALDEEPLMANLRKYYNWKQPVPDAIHAKAMFLFRQYILVGGMPQSVKAYIENDRSFRKVDAVKRQILDLYRADIAKIAAPYRSKVQSIFDQIPGFLSSAEKRVIYKKIDDGSSFMNYADTFFWLSDSMIVNDCFNCANPDVGLALNENRTYVKCYMGDTGLLISMAFSENEIADNELYREILYGKLSTNEGMLFENVVAQMLVAAGHKLFFYTHYNEETKKKDIKIDFLLSNNSKLKYKVWPVEVKSSTRYFTTSLTRFDARFKPRIGGNYVIHIKNLKQEGDTLYLPVYMTGFL